MDHKEAPIGAVVSRPSPHKKCNYEDQAWYRFLYDAPGCSMFPSCVGIDDDDDYGLFPPLVPYMSSGFGYVCGS